MRSQWGICILIAGLAMLLAAGCAPQSTLPQGPTPIPTLAPVTVESGVLEPTAAPSFAILSYPASPPSASEGQDIYLQNCVECHGPDGTGAIPAARNFQDLDYIRGESPANLYAVVTEGRGGMPSYKSLLTSDERWDAVFFIWRLSTTGETLEMGEEIYEANCAACHGPDGSGELLGSADFTELRQMDELAPRDLYLTVTQGRGSMPAWQSRLSQDERWAVIDYLRTFSYDPSLDQEVAAGPTPTPITPTGCDAEQTNPYDWREAEPVEAGEAVYAAQCAVCHGQDGSGGLPGTPHFTTAEVSADLRERPGHYYCAVTVGEGAMPVFEDSLSAEERWQVITFLSSLGP